MNSWGGREGRGEGREGRGEEARDANWCSSTPPSFLQHTPAYSSTLYLEIYLQLWRLAQIRGWFWDENFSLLVLLVWTLVLKNEVKEKEN